MSLKIEFFEWISPIAEESLTFVPSLRGAVKAENIPIEPDLDNASEGKMTR